YEGFYFWGANAGNGNLQSNYIHSHYNGLHVDLSSTIGTQYHQGNLWLAPSYAHYGAWDANPTAAFFQNIWYNSLSLNHVPASNSYSPSYWFFGEPIID